MARDPLGPAARGRLGGDALRDLIEGDDQPARESPPAAPAPPQAPVAATVPAVEEEGRAERPSTATGASRGSGGKRARGPKKVARPHRGAIRRAAATAGQRVAFSVRIPSDLLERARNAAFWRRAALNDLFTEGLALRLDELEEEHGPFKPREEDLRPGRKFK